MASLLNYIDLLARLLFYFTQKSVLQCGLMLQLYRKKYFPQFSFLFLKVFSSLVDGGSIVPRLGWDNDADRPEGWPNSIALVVLTS